MEEKKKLIKLNLLAYINNYAYIFIGSKIEIKNLLSLWVLTPFIFLFLTSFILENKYKKERAYIKKYAICDWVVRFLGACSAFTELGLHFNVKIVLCSMFMIINILIEVKMLKMKPVNNIDNGINKYDNKIDTQYAGKYVTMGIGGYILTTFFFGMQMVMYKYKLVISIIIVILYSVVFAKVEYNKIKECYKDGKVAKKLIIRNILIFYIGVIMWIIQKIYFRSDLDDNFLNFVIVISLLPSIVTTRNIGIAYKVSIDKM